MYDTCVFNAHGSPAQWRLVNKHGEEYGACHEHLAPTMVVLFTNDAPVTIDPIPSRWPAIPAGQMYPSQVCANCGTAGTPTLEARDQRWLCERCL